MVTEINILQAFIHSIQHCLNSIVVFAAIQWLFISAALKMCPKVLKVWPEFSNVLCLNFQL